MRPTIPTVVLLLGTAMPALSQNYDQCRHEAQKTANVDASGARLLLVRAGAGSLKIEGRAGLDRVIVRGRACASDARLLDEIELRTDRSGSEVTVESMRREQGWRFSDNGYARLDLVIEVPASMAADIQDGSGSIEIANLGAVDITDGSGEIDGRALHGDVRVHDGSGWITLTGVAGGVDVRDGSGSIELRDIGGAIEIADGSGEIGIQVARSSIRISDGSGGIDVADVEGDFVVSRDGSGGISHTNVRGRVDIPTRRGRRREAL